MRAALRSPLLVAGAALVGLLVVAAVFAPLLAPYDPRGFVADSLQPPSRDHLLGTNNLGQDMLSQIVWGARASLVVAAGSAAIAVTVGIAVGVGSGLLGGMVDTAVMRVVDVFLAVPRLPLLVLAGAFVGAERTWLVVLIGLLMWPVLARLLRSETLSLRRRGFVASARGFGAGPAYVLGRHLVPALGPIVASSFIAIAGNAILLEAGLAFLGVGDPIGISWGLILNRALATPGLYFSPAWTWWVLPTGFAITLAVLGFALLGVGLEPILNPRWKRAR